MQCGCGGAGCETARARLAAAVLGAHAYSSISTLLAGSVLASAAAPAAPMLFPSKLRGGRRWREA